MGPQRRTPEVLVPLAQEKRGEWLPVSHFRDSKEVATYFQKVLKKPVWEAEDFGAHFEGRRCEGRRLHRVGKFHCRWHHPVKMLRRWLRSTA